MSTMETREEMQSRHRKEAKDLQSRVTQKKKNASKKTRKGVSSECDELERQLKERQAQEMATLSGQSAPAVDEVPGLEEDESEDTKDSAGLTNGVNEATEQLADTAMSETATSEDGQPRKRNRAKERLARRAAETAAAVEEAKKEAANQPSAKDIERKKMLVQFKEHGLVEKSIRPDGHCLFSAIADQLSQLSISLGPENDTELREDQRYKVVRKAAAKYIEGHPDDFAGWLDEPLESYAEKIRDTAEWGGHLELLALAKTYKVEICVLQDGAPQTIEPGDVAGKDPERIWLAYYRHGFGLGEHYNSLRKSP